MKNYRDKNGRKIEPGDLLKTFHFRNANRRKGIDYLYHVVVEKEGRLWAVPVCNLNPEHCDVKQGGECLISVFGKDAEIIYGYGLPGTMNHYKYRPKMTVEETQNDPT